MKKKILALLIVMTVILSACGQNKQSAESAQSTSNVESSTEVSIEEVSEQKNMIGGEEKGEGLVYIINSSGDSRDGNVITVDKGMMVCQIGLNSKDMDGKQYIIFVDGNEKDTKTLGNSQNNISLKDDDLSEGIHNVEVIAKEGGAEVFYRLMNYEVK